MKSNRLVLLFTATILLLLACKVLVPETPTEAPTSTEAPVSTDEPNVEPPTEEPPLATEAPVTDVPATEQPISASTEPAVTEAAQPEPRSPYEQLAEVDAALKQSARANIAYNAPSEMHLNETVSVQLLLDPSLTEQELKEQISEPGPVRSTGNVEITRRMRVELIAQDRDAFTINAIPENPEQVISPTSTTEWKWLLTAKKEGPQTLTLVVYRLVQFEKKDYWRKVQSYKADIAVNVTLQQRVQLIDWKWWTGILVTAILIPAFWRWVENRKKEELALKHEISKPSNRKENIKPKKK